MTEKQNQDSCHRENSTEVHYRLTHEEFLAWIEKYDLKWSEVKLYLYFCTLNPFGDRDIDFSAAEVCSKLNLKKSAFYSAVERLEELGLLDLKVSRSKAKVIPINRTSFHLNGKDSILVETCPIQRKDFHLNGKDSSQTENHQLQPLQRNDSSAPHTYSYYSNFIQTLSDSERESFEKFVKEEWKKRKGEDIFSIERFLLEFRLKISTRVLTNSNRHLRNISKVR